MNRRTFLHNVLAAGAACGAGAGILVGSGSAAGREVGLRPPGALDEDEFLARCIRCFRCGDACPNRAIVALNPATGRDSVTRIPDP